MNATFASRLVRRWVALYTRGLPVEVRLARIAEIDSDLWSQHDEAQATGRSGRSLAVEILVRMVLGIAADVGWRVEHERLSNEGIRRDTSRGTRVIALLAIVGGISWAIAVADWAVTASTDPGVKIWQQPVVAATGLTGLFALSLSLGGIGYFLLYRYDSAIGLYGLAGAICGVISGLGAPGAIVFLPAASIAVVLFLARIHAVRWPVALVHTGAAPGIYLGLAAYRDASLIGITSIFVIVYCVTWVAIGVELLRGLPVPRTAPSTELPHPA